MRQVAILVGLLVATSVGCKRATDSPLGPPAALVLTRAFDYQGHVTQVTKECGCTPGFGGCGCQYAVWFAKPPATAPDAGVVVGDSTPVFVGGQGLFSRSSGSAVATGDMIQIWTEGGTAYGAVQSPPGTPCYFAAQIVIVR
jgi:hypothetical protein